MARTTNNGFTIIEVVLVLAVAGLIFLMVFVALPALQRNQRDSQRKQDMQSVAAELTNYRANNGGIWPFSTGTNYEYNSTDSITSCATTNPACIFVRDYMNTAGASENSFKDPDNTIYNVYFYGTESNNPKDSKLKKLDKHTIIVKLKAQCKNESPYWEWSTIPSNFVVIYKLETSGYICIQSE